MFEKRIEREYKLKISVIVDDPDKTEYQADMEKFCNSILRELRSIFSNMTKSSNRATLETERVK